MNLFFTRNKVLVLIVFLILFILVSICTAGYAYSEWMKYDNNWMKHKDLRQSIFSFEFQDKKLIIEFGGASDSLKNYNDLSLSTSGDNIIMNFDSFFWVKKGDDFIIYKIKGESFNEKKWQNWFEKITPDLSTQPVIKVGLNNLKSLSLIKLTSFKIQSVQQYGMTILIGGKKIELELLDKRFPYVSSSIEHFFQNL